jgi:hypothetical protein
MSHIKDNWVENEVFHASDLNELAGVVNGLTDSEADLDSRVSALEAESGAGYYTKSEVDVLLANKAGKQHMHPMTNIIGLPAALEEKQDVIEDLDEIRSGASMVSELKTEVDGKQDIIEDLDEIRSGAALASTSIQVVRLTQTEYDELVSAGTISETTLYIITEHPTRTVHVTFEDYDGTTLQEEDVLVGTVPEYTGDTPTRADDYDPAENLGTEYTFNGWNPEVGEVTANTTYVAQYSTRQYRYVTVNKFVKEETGSISADKDYIFVGLDVSYVGELHLAINDEFTTNKVFSKMEATIYTEQTFDNIKEFRVEGDQPRVFLGLYPDGEAFYLRDKTDDGYIGSSTASTGSNTFSAKEYVQEGDDPSLVLSSKFRWAFDENMGIVNITYGRSIRYNQSMPRFAPYKTGQFATYLFYEVQTREKEYINNRRSLKSTKPQSNLPVAYFQGYVSAEGIEEPEER